MLFVITWFIQKREIVAGAGVSVTDKLLLLILTPDSAP